MEQFDITEFAKMFDAALASDNPAVKKALRNFMIVTAIVHAEDQNSAERSIGPLETLVKKVSDLEVMVHAMQNNRTVKDYYGNNPTWVYKPNTTVTSTTSGTTSWVDKQDIDIYQYLKDIKLT